MRNSSYRKTKLLPNSNLNQQENETNKYNDKLQKLLDKIQAQNRYSNRITISNYINMSKLQQATKQIQQIKQARKMEQLNEIQLKNLNNNLNIQLTQMKQKLLIAINDYIQTKKQLKIQQQTVKKLQNQNTQLQITILAMKRKSMQNITQFKMKITDDLLENQVKDFLAKTNWRQSILIQHSRKCVLENNFQNFFEDLERKIQAYEQTKNSLICPRLVRSHSRKVYESQNHNQKPYRYGTEIRNISNEKKTIKFDVSKRIHRRAQTIGSQKKQQS